MCESLPTPTFQKAKRGAPELPGPTAFDETSVFFHAQETVNVPLLAVPPGVVTAILPVFAPTGTVAVTCVAEFTVNAVALTPPNVTFVAPVNPAPAIVTCVPTGPLVGAKLLITGMTLNFLLLVRVPEGVVTVTNPVVPVEGTTAVM